MQEIILTIGIIAYVLFFIQFIAALIGFDTDFDIDIDFDGDADFSFSDVVSFKGILHFIMGVTTYLYTQLHNEETLTIYSWLIAVVVGVVFVVGLYYIYKWCLSLQHTPAREEGDLGERYVTIIRQEKDFTYVGSTTINGAFDMFVVEASTPLTIGSRYRIKNFKNNTIYV